MVEDLTADRQPRRAASIAAMSIFPICIIASKARLAAERSGPVMAAMSARGVICVELRGVQGGAVIPKTDRIPGGHVSSPLVTHRHRLPPPLTMSTNSRRLTETSARLASRSRIDIAHPSPAPIASTA